LTRLFAGSFFASFLAYGFRLMKSVGAANSIGADDIKRMSVGKRSPAALGQTNAK
jgi:hypothetical protein